MIQSLKRLLFVDDEPNIRSTLAVILRRYGFSVTLAATVGQALEHIQNQPFDLLICDLNIERENDGYEVIRAMQEVNPRCVTIVLTGYPGVSTAVEGLRLGIDDYLLKPANANQLVALLAEKLASRQPKARILTVAYDQLVLQTWRMLLENQRYEVVAALGMDAAIKVCESQVFDILFLGNSVPLREKQKLVAFLRKRCSTPVISVNDSPDISGDDGADYHLPPDPQRLLDRIAEIVRKKQSSPANPLTAVPQTSSELGSNKPN